MAQTDPIGVFEATVAGVAALVPAAPILDELRPGQKGVIASQVEAWIDELSNAVDLRLAGRERLRSDDRKAALVDAARGVVHNGAASYVEAARYSERASVAETTYGDVLWKRYTEGLQALVSLLAEWLHDQDDSAAEPSSSPAWCFPASAFPDGMRF